MQVQCSLDLKVCLSEKIYFCCCQLSSLCCCWSGHIFILISLFGCSKILLWNWILSLCRPVIIDFKESLYFSTQSQGKSSSASLLDPLTDDTFVSLSLQTFEGSDFTIILSSNFAPSFCGLKVLSPVHSWLLKQELVGYKVKSTHYHLYSSASTIG